MQSSLIAFFTALITADTPCPTETQLIVYQKKKKKLSQDMLFKYQGIL